VITRNQTKSRLAARIRSWLANPAESEIRTVSSDEGTATLHAVTRHQSNIEIPLFRCSHKITKQRKGRTLMRYVASILARCDSESQIIKVTDKYGCAEHASSLSEVGFVGADDAFYKIQLRGIWEPPKAAAEIASMKGIPKELAERFDQQFTNLSSPESFLEIERLIAPGKLRSGNKVPCFVIPIRPDFARALFDENLGQRGFWDEDADLLFNPLSVYYSGATITPQPGRLLWYVSDKVGYMGKRIRACSQLRGVAVDEPLNLYRRFRHFGVYSLQNVENLATEKRPNVKAMEFSDTELLKSPITLKSIRNVLASEKQTFQGPTSISESQFLTLYEHGMSNASSVDTTELR
jgi:hypothetical protein